MKIFDLKKKNAQRIMLVLISFIWGTSFILIKRGLESFNEFQVGNMRIFFASIFLMPFLFKRIKKLKRKHIKSLLIVGFIGNLFPAMLYAKAQTELNSSLAAMLNTLFPVISLIIGFLFYKTKTKKNQILGILVGLSGALGLVSGGNINLSESNNFFALYVILALIFYSFSLYEIKLKLTELDGITITIFAFAITGPVAGISLLFSGLPEALSRPEAIKNLLFVILLALGSSALAVTLFYNLTDYVDVVFASLITYIIPVFAIFWGIFDGEKISLIQIICMIIIFIGIYLVNKNGKNKPEK